MATKLPETIRRYAEAHKPPTHDLVWMRCSYMQAAEIERPPRISNLLGGRKKEIPRDTHLQLRDVDADEGWDVRIQGTGHDIHPDDLFSLVGPAPEGADRLTEPAVLLNHMTGVFWRCYRDTNEAHGRLLTELDYKRSLAFRSPSTLRSRLEGVRYTLAGWFTSPLTPARDRLRSAVLASVLAAYVLAWVWLLRLGGVEAVAQATYEHPWLLVVLIPLVLLVVALHIGVGAVTFILTTAYLIHLGIRLTMAVMEPPRFKDQVEYSFSQLCGWSNVTDWLGFVHVDQTYLYQETLNRLHTFVLANPDEEAGFVVAQVRGRGKKGFLAQAAPEDLLKAA